jgi:hypothetical protein
MHLALGLCYAVLLADGTVVEFRFLGNAGPKGQIVGESPSGSGTQVDLLQLLSSSFADFEGVRERPGE